MEEYIEFKINNMLELKDPNNYESFEEYIESFRLNPKESDQYKTKIRKFYESERFKNKKEIPSKEKEFFEKSEKNIIFSQKKEYEFVEKSNQLIVEVIFDKMLDVEFVSLIEKNLFQLLDKIVFHFQKYIRAKKLSLNEFLTNGKLLVLDAKDNSNRNEHDIKLKSPLIYKLLPNSIKLNFFFNNNLLSDETIDDFFQKVELENLNKEYLIKFVNFENKKEPQEKIHFQRFKNFCYYFLDIKYPPLEYKNIEDSFEDIRRNSNGFDTYAKKIETAFKNSFTSKYFDKAKGVLFHGPPRTGKTYICQQILKKLNLFSVYPPVSAGDFKKPLQGQSEQMMNMIAKRCKVLCWELCTLFIDEIDGLAPNRTGASEGAVNLLSVILALMDGSKKKSNLLIIGTTNLPKKLDDAFKQRFDIQIFIGLPSFDSRREWIYKMAEKDEKRLENIFIQHLLKKEKGLISYIQEYTINFTADAMKKSLGQIYNYLNILNEKYCKLKDIDEKKLFLILQLRNLGANIEDTKNEDDLISLLLKELIFEKLESICSSDKLYISNYFIPSFVRKAAELPWFTYPAQKNNLISFEDIFGSKTPKDIFFSKRVLVEFSNIDKNKIEAIQFEVNEKPKEINYSLEKLRKFLSYKNEYVEFEKFLEDGISKDVENLYNRIQKYKFFEIIEKKNENKFQRYYNILFKLEEFYQNFVKNETIQVIFETNDVTVVKDAFNNFDKYFTFLGLSKNLITKQNIKNSYNSHVEIKNCFKKFENTKDYYTQTYQAFIEFYNSKMNEMIEIEMKINKINKNFVLKNDFETNVFLCISGLKELGKQMKTKLLTYSYEKLAKFELICHFIHNAKINNFNFLEIIDSSLFLHKQLNSDEEWSHEVIRICEEAAEYSSSLLIFDLETLADIEKNYSNLSQDIRTGSNVAFQEDKSNPTFSYEINRKKTYQTVLDIFERGVLDSNKNHWIIAISGNLKLSLDFKNKLNWPPTQEDLDIEEDIKRKTSEKTCINCLKKFTDKENTSNECGIHLKNGLYLESDLKFEEDIKNDKLEKLKEQYRKSYQDTYLFEIIELKKQNLIETINKYDRQTVKAMIDNSTIVGSDAKYLCCGKGLFDSGCVPSPHFA